MSAPESSLDVSSLEKAVARLEEGITRYQQEKEDAMVRDAVVQRFEYTFSLSVRMIKRYLREHGAEGDLVEEMTFNVLIRTADRAGLLRSNLEKWIDYRQKRNMTSHTYNEEKALDVVSLVGDFSLEARYLLEALKTRI
ncbi:MAG: nucleotidyltransferase substrate binding protein [Holosporales bacterium]|jgi:nucleotidyltransferase substrate binding protein (TIGR01987 family)|nr:nucleotidyltransferase substrate binding protein [Holosporales bacterium]